jgi:hypothetical protein
VTVAPAGHDSPFMMNPATDPVTPATNRSAIFVPLTPPKFNGGCVLSNDAP